MRLYHCHNWSPIRLRPQPDPATDVLIRAWDANHASELLRAWLRPEAEAFIHRPTARDTASHREGWLAAKTRPEWMKPLPIHEGRAEVLEDWSSF
jgi:hypothetical protein